MKQLLSLQKEFASIRKGNSAFDRLQASQYDEKTNEIILSALSPYVTGSKEVPEWYRSWCSASIAVKGQALYIMMTKHPLAANIHPTHFKALISVMAFESKLLPLVINKGTDGLNSNLIKKNLAGGAAFGLDQRIASRKYDLIETLSSSNTTVFDLGKIKNVVDFILNDINDNPDLRVYKSIIMGKPSDIKTEILNCVQLYEGLSRKYSDQWFISERLSLFNTIFS